MLVNTLILKKKVIFKLKIKALTEVIIQLNNVNPTEFLGSITINLIF